ADRVTGIGERCVRGRTPLLAAAAQRSRCFDLPKRQSQVHRRSAVVQSARMHLEAAAGCEGVSDADAMTSEHHGRAIVPVPLADADAAETDVVLIILHTLCERG